MTNNSLFDPIKFRPQPYDLIVRIIFSSPKAWCATGNCFSLQKEHDTAIKFFQRAVQVNPPFTYAYTLLGHEYVLTEELDRAMSCFRQAVRTDSRHYNAWLVGCVSFGLLRIVIG